MSVFPDSDFSSIPPWRRWVVQWDISHNAISLAFFAFTAMFQTASLHFGMVNVPHTMWYSLFFISCALLFVNIILFLIRAVIFPQAIVQDFRNPRLVNFFFMPVMIGALLVLTTPPFLNSLTYFVVGFYVLATYQLVLTLYLYGEWLFGANPTNFIHPLVFMQTIGFFLTANIGATAHLEQQARAMFSVGCLFWLLVFITNFQHVATAMDNRSERPQPTFFLFIAPPAQAALSVVILEAAKNAEDTSKLLSFGSQNEMSWPVLAESFHYVDLFIYLLMFRLFPTFWTTKFAVSWWAYIFPLSAAAAATIWRFKSEGHSFWGILAALLSIIACLAMAVVFCLTVWALATQRVPYNKSALTAYRSRYNVNVRGAPPEGDFPESNFAESDFSQV